MSHEFLATVWPDENQWAFVLGARAYRISLHTQQARAIRLAGYLSDMKQWQSEVDRVAIIGGGVAGITIAVALALQGKSVYLFEQRGRLLPLQNGNFSRYVHPFAVNWPQTSYDPSTKLPFLNWYADYAHPISQKIFDKFWELKKRKSLDIVERLNERVISVERTSLGGGKNGYKIASEKELLSFDAVFFSEGFGLERKLSSSDNFSYWEESSVTAKNTNTHPTKIAVIGDGDGALIDAIRSVFRYSDLEFIYNEVALRLASKDFKQKIARLEARLNFKSGVPVLPQEYHDLFFEEAGKDTVRKFFSCIEDSEFHITLITPNKNGFSVQSSPLNKFLLSYLASARKSTFKIVQMIAGSVSANPLSLHGPFEFHVMPSDKKEHKADEDYFQEELGPFDRVIERIGPFPNESQLLRDLFDGDLLTEFFKESSQKFNFANPCDVDDSLMHCWADDAKELWVNEGTNDLLSYLSEVLSADNPENAAQIGYNHKIDTFEITGVTLPKPRIELQDSLTIDEKRSPSDEWRKVLSRPDVVNLNYSGFSRLDELPGKWYGYDLNKENIGEFGVPVRREWYGATAKTSFGKKPEEVLSDITKIHPGTRIQLCKSELKIPPDGRLSYFVRASSGSDRLYGITAKHILQSTHNDGAVCVVGFATDRRKAVKTRPVGKVSYTEFDDVIQSEMHQSIYSCLSDVVIFPIDPKVAWENTVDGSSLSTVISAFEVADYRREPLFFGQELLGNVTKTFNHTRIRFPIGGSLPTEVFTIELDDNVDPEIILSGSPVHTSNTELVGFVVGGRNNELFCVESKKVHGKLGLSLA